MSPRVSRRIDADVQLEITELALQEEKWTPAQIYREVTRQEEFKDRVSLRTVERLVKELRAPSEDSAPWTISDSGGEEAREVLDARRELIRYSERRVRRFTRGEARWVAKMRRVAPDLPPDIAWLVAVVYRRFYSSVTDRGEDEIIEGLDHYLAFAPWRDEDHFREYKNAVEQGWIPAAPMWDRLVER